LKEEHETPNGNVVRLDFLNRHDQTLIFEEILEPANANRPILSSSSGPMSVFGKLRPEKMVYRRATNPSSWHQQKPHPKRALVGN